MKRIKQAAGQLNEILKARKITQLQLSELSGVPQTTISRFDRASLHTMANVFAIAEALGVKVEDLFRVEYEEKDAD